MGRVITVSEPALDMMLYGDNSSTLSAYLMQQMQQIGPVFNEFSQRLYNNLQNSYNFITDKLTQYGILSQVQSAGGVVLDNYYETLNTFTELQNANLTMQRWIMSHPETRQLYLDQNIDGYSGSYQNVFGKEVGEDDYNYRRVMDGVVQDTTDGNGFVIKYYLEDLLPSDTELDHFKRVHILNTYDTITWLYENSKFDFTCTSEEPVKINRE